MRKVKSLFKSVGQAALGLACCAVMFDETLISAPLPLRFAAACVWVYTLATMIFVEEE